MAPMTTGEIKQLYSNTTSLSANKASANYYAPDGAYKSTNLSTGKVSKGRWYTKEPDQICIKGTREMCFSVSKSDSSVSFSNNGNTSSRKLSDYMPGDQTSKLMK